jgi:hypothetical protein
MTVQSINYGAVQTAYVSSASYTLDTEDQHINLFWPTPYTTATDICAAANNFTVTAANCSISLPNANEVSLGMNIYIRNVDASTETFSVFDNNANLLQTIDAGTTWWFQLIAYANDTGGEWAIIEQGAGTSQASAAALAGHGLEAVAAKLDTVIPPEIITTNYAITEDDQSKIFIINSAAERTITLGQFRGGFTVSFNNIGTGNVNFIGTVNNLTNFSLATTQSVTLINDETDTTKWWTLGLGSSTSFIDSVVNISLTAQATGGEVTLSANQLNNFIHQFFSASTITGDITIYYGNTDGNWYIANFCGTSNGSKIYISAGSPAVPIGSPIEVPMGTKIIAYLANDPLLSENRLFVVPTSYDIATLLLEDGTINNPSLAFQSDSSSGLFLPAQYQPTVVSHGVKIATFDGVIDTQPAILINPGDKTYPSYSFLNYPTMGLNADGTYISFYKETEIAALTSNGNTSTGLDLITPDGDELAIGMTNLGGGLTATLGGLACNLNLVPGTNTANMVIESDGGFSNTFTVNANGSTLTTNGNFPSTFQFLGATTTTSLLKFYNNSDTNKYTILGQSGVDVSGNDGSTWYYTEDGGTTTARLRLTNAANTTRSKLDLYSPANGLSLFFEAYPNDGRIGYAGIGRISINTAGVVTFDQRGPTLNALLPNPAVAGNMIAYDGTNWVLTPNPNNGSFLYYKAAGWAATAAPGANALSYYNGTDWTFTGSPNAGSFAYFNGTNWVNTAAANAGGLAYYDGTLWQTSAAPVASSMTYYNGTAWQNTAAAAAGDLLYYNGTNWVSITTPIAGSLLYYDGATWQRTATPASGDILYYNAGAWVTLPVGTDGQVLTLAAGLPTWA